MFILYNMADGEFETFTTPELFEMINRDRSHEWSDYTEQNTLAEITEAINEFCAPYTTNVN